MSNWQLNVALGLFIAFLMACYRWMYQVKDNHLAHIQRAVEKTAVSSAVTNQVIRELAIREEERHKQEMQAHEELKTLIRTRGL